METTINLGRVKGSLWYVGSANSAADIANEISTAGKTATSQDIYLNVGNGNVYQYAMVEDTLTWVLKGNIKGVKGDPFAVAKTFPSVASMNSGYAEDGVPVGSFVIIETGNVDDDENARLYVKGAKSYEYITDLSGAQGIKGDRGETGPKGDTGAKGDTGQKGDTGAAAGFGEPVIKVTGLPAGSTPAAEIVASGPDTAKIFTITLAIPQGAKGDTGAQGATGARGETGAQGVKGETGEAAGFGTPMATAKSLAAGSAPTVTVTTSGDDTEKVFSFTFGIPKGDKGDIGTTGAKGADGKTPTFSINGDGELIATFA